MFPPLLPKNTRASATWTHVKYASVCTEIVNVQFDRDFRSVASEIESRLFKGILLIFLRRFIAERIRSSN